MCRVCVCVVNVLIFILFSFFQAEDGIRDTSVTGVQTCALPICWLRPTAPDGLGANFARRLQRGATRDVRGPDRPRAPARSEERRVGKECRSRWSPYH